jgi:cell division protein ZapD
MQDYTIYEHPLNERIRMMMKLEHLFRQTMYFISQENIWASRIFVSSLLDILDLFSRGDIRTELLKELERSTENLGQLMSYPNVDHDRLGSILRALEHLIENIHAMNTAPGTELKNNELISTIRQRSTIPGGTCDFDLPRFNLWLHSDHKKRLQDQKEWFVSLDPIRQTIDLLLKMIRGSAEFQDKQAESGNHTEQLEKTTPYQLVRVRLPNSANYFAEISGSKHRFSIRFMEPSESGKNAPLTQCVPFQLSLCRL